MYATNFSRGHFRRLALVLISVAVSLMWGSCSDDDSGSGPAGVGGDPCADVQGDWIIVLGFESLLMELEQTSSCEVTGQSLAGHVVEGYATPDSLYLEIGLPDSDPSTHTRCLLTIVSDELMDGYYLFGENFGEVTMVRPDPYCGGSVDLQVSSGLTPTFSWPSKCKASWLLVESNDGGGDVWFVGDDEANALSSPITYGQAPQGVPADAATPLVAGESYTAILVRWTGGGAEYMIIGHKDFTP
jgi:hypothetical protein